MVQQYTYITFFLSFIVYDSRYQQTSSCATCCCNKVTNLSSGVKHESSGGIEMETRNTNDKASDTAASSHKGKAGTKTSMIEPEASSYIMEKLGSLILDHTMSKVIIVLLFIGYLVGATIGILDLHAYTDPVELAPNDSYLFAMYDAWEKYFDVIGPPIQFIMDKPLDYSDPDVFAEIEKMVIDIRNDECFLNDSDFTESWVHSYYEYIDNNYPSDIVDINQSMFYENLYNEYLLSDAGKQFITHIWPTIISREVGMTTLDELQVDMIETEIFSEEIIGAKAYQGIERTRIYLSMVPVGAINQWH